jgi:hypothetical protein
MSTLKIPKWFGVTEVLGQIIAPLRGSKSASTRVASQHDSRSWRNYGVESARSRFPGSNYLSQDHSTPNAEGNTDSVIENETFCEICRTIDFEGILNPASSSDVTHLYTSPNEFFLLLGGLQDIYKKR